MSDLAVVGHEVLDTTDALGGEEPVQPAGWKFPGKHTQQESPRVPHAHAPLTSTGRLLMVRHHLIDGKSQSPVTARADHTTQRTSSMLR